MKKHSKIKREIIDTYIVFSNNDNSKNIIVFKDTVLYRVKAAVSGLISHSLPPV